MTIELTKLSKGQWKRVGKVIMWLAISGLCAGALALITKNDKLLATLPGWNVLGVFIQGLLTTEEGTALDNLPPEVKTEAEQIIAQVEPPTVQTPPSA